MLTREGGAPDNLRYMWILYTLSGSLFTHPTRKALLPQKDIGKCPEKASFKVQA